MSPQLAALFAEVASRYGDRVRFATLDGTAVRRLTVGALAGTIVGGVATQVWLMRTGRLTLDTGWGRTLHPVGPMTFRIDAPRDLVFDQLASPYLGRTPKELREHLEVQERGEDLVLARHWTESRFVTAQTVETVGFERPERIRFRHVRGPVPHAREEFVLAESDGGTELVYRGELGLDFWLLGSLAARHWVIPEWERAVRTSLESAKDGAEQRARARARRTERRAD